jgi:hypothetical protein
MKEWLILSPWQEEQDLRDRHERGGEDRGDEQVTEQLYQAQSLT